VLVDPFFYATAIPAVIVMGLAKGGFAGLGLLAVPLMALAVSPMQAASITLPILIVQDVVGVWAFRHSWDARILALMLPSAAIGIAIGYALAAHVSSAAVELAVGAVSILFALQRLWAERHGATVVANASPFVGALCGVVAGFTSQIAHAGGPPFQMYVLPKRLARDTFIGTSALFFAVVNWIKVPAYLALGQFTPTNLLTSAVLLPLAIGSTAAGVWLVRRVSGEGFYRIVYALLVLVGVKLVWDGAVALV
jgi:uncharacterized membrane protein YfcA